MTHQKDFFRRKRSFLLSGYGGIGRHARFRFWCASVQVQVLLPALLKNKKGWCITFDAPPFLIFRNPEDSLNRFKVSASLRSAQNRGHPGPRVPCSPHVRGVLRHTFFFFFFWTQIHHILGVYCGRLAL